MVPKFGICSGLNDATMLKNQGWDYLEENVQTFLQPHVPDAAWTGPQQAKACELPIRAGYVLFPSMMKLTGPEADIEAAADYFIVVARRAQAIGMQLLNFGSAASRSVPEGFDPDEGRRQLVEFCRTIAPLAQHHGLVLSIESMDRESCNLINTVTQATLIAEEVDHPAFGVTIDTYHIWKDEEPLDHVDVAMPFLKHVHLGDLQDRCAPGESGQSDYHELFDILKQGGYRGMMSVECKGFDPPTMGRRVLHCIKGTWNEV